MEGMTATISFLPHSAASWYAQALHPSNRIPYAMLVSPIPCRVTVSASRQAHCSVPYTESCSPLPRPSVHSLLKLEQAEVTNNVQRTSRPAAHESARSLQLHAGR